ncbi:MAG: ABC transporter ATP-binding protein [Clostridia bacterium]|nr:ABC transporter ATP-binding protein [Clostridia bacterium]
MLELKNVSSGYGKLPVLQNVSLSVEKGGVLSIVGPNGSGKSTLLKTAVGILNLAEGEITVDGTPIGELAGKQLAQRVAYLPQGKSVPDMTVGQLVLHGRFPYIGFPRRYTEKDVRIAREVLEKMGLSDLYDRRLKTLSGGMRQKAYIAMALAQDTDYILFDEPTTYLDISHQLEFMEIIKSLTDIGKGVITVMHDLPLAFNFSDRIIVMNEGRVVADSFPQELQSSGIINEVFGVYLTKTVDTKMYVLDYHKGI